MNSKEKRTYDYIIKMLRNYSDNDMWGYILEEQDGEYNIALPMTMDILDIIIKYEKGKKNIDEKIIEDYIKCYRLLYDLEINIDWDNYLNS